MAICRRRRWPIVFLAIYEKTSKNSRRRPPAHRATRKFNCASLAPVMSFAGSIFFKRRSSFSAPILRKLKKLERSSIFFRFSDFQAGLVGSVACSILHHLSGAPLLYRPSPASKDELQRTACGACLLLSLPPFTGGPRGGVPLRCRTRTCQPSISFPCSA